jgi:flagellar hook-basal body complex protein FliE
MKVTQISGPAPNELQRAVRPTQGSSAEFVSLLDKFVGDVNDRQMKAEEAVRALAAGKIENVHDVMLAEVEADLSFRMLAQTRNKLVEAYREVMRMQI